MGQILIRNRDDALIADYREAPARNNLSLETELRETLQTHQPMTARRHRDLLARPERIRAMTPTRVDQTPSEELLRPDRDGLRD